MLYFLELERPLQGGKNRFYLGYSEDSDTCLRRIKAHQKGRGAVFTREAVKQAIPFKCVLIIPEGTRADERKYKRWKKHRQVIDLFRRKGYGTWGW